MPLRRGAERGVSGYRIEWPTRGRGAADRWIVVADAVAARRGAARLLLRRRAPAAWVRIVLIVDGADAEDRFVTAEALGAWSDGASLPPAIEGARPVAEPEIERLRGRALAGLDLVLGWSIRHGVLSPTAAEGVRLTFDAALLGITAPAGDAAFRRPPSPRRR